MDESLTVQGFGEPGEIPVVVARVGRLCEDDGLWPVRIPRRLDHRSLKANFERIS